MQTMTSTHTHEAIRAKAVAVAVAVRCTGKVDLGSHDRAKAVLSRDGNSKGRSAYHCHACGGWHVGNSIKKRSGPPHRVRLEQLRHEEAADDLDQFL